MSEVFVMRLEAQELRVLAAVVEHRGFKRAAEKLHVSQSAVSQTIASLERKLEQRLLQRKPLEPTEAGIRLLTYAQHLAREEEILLEDLGDILRGQSAKLSLAVNSAINRYHAPDLLKQYCGEKPYARLQVEELPSRQIIQSVVAGAVELGMGPFQTQMHAFDTLPLFDEVRTLVVSRKHPLVESLMAEPMSVLSRVPLVSSYMDDPEERPRMQRIRDHFSQVWEVRSITLRMELLAAGYGVGYVSDQVLAEEKLSAELLVVEGVPFARIGRSVGVFWRKDSNLSSGAETFLDLCRRRWSP
jgi:DNA-binding transcriptional LysR family regulator